MFKEEQKRKGVDKDFFGNQVTTNQTLIISRCWSVIMLRYGIKEVNSSSDLFVMEDMMHHVRIAHPMSGCIDGL